jgi:MFS family permease
MSTEPARPAAAQRAQTTEIWPAAVGIATILSVVAPGFLAGALVVRMRSDFGFSDTALGIAIGLSYAAGALTSWPAGKLVDRIGPIAGIQLGAALAFASSLAIALFAHSAAAVVVFLVLAGLANAVGSPGAASLVRRHLSPARQGVGIGIQQAGAPAGALLAGLMLPAVAVPFGWRAGFAVSAAIGLLTALAAGPLRGRDPAERTREHPDAGEESMRQPVRLAVAAALGNTAIGGMVAFVVTAAVDAGGSEALAGTALALSSLGALAARVGFGARLDRRGGQVLGPVPAMFVAGAAGLVLAATGSPAAIVAGAIVGGTVGWGWSGLTLLAAIEANPRVPGAAAGVVMTGVYVGAAAGPVLFGLLADHVSFTSAWLASAALALGAAGVARAARAAQPPRERTTGPARLTADRV